LTRFTILFDQPLEHLNTIGDDGKTYALAFKAVDDQRPEALLFALQCPTLPVPNFELLNIRDLNHNPFYMSPVGHFISNSPAIPDQFLHFFIFDNFDYKKITFDKPWTSTKIINDLWKPALDVLRKLNDKGMGYRALRIHNLYENNNGSIVMGENISAPPGFLQGAAMEPLDQYQCVPYGREYKGAHDVYGLAVLSLFLLLGINPWTDNSENEIAIAKSNFGSFNGLMYHLNKKINIPSTNPMFMDIIAKMLIDDPNKRPSLMEIQEWVKNFSGSGNNSIVHNDSPPFDVKPLRLGNLDTWVKTHLALGFYIRTHLKESYSHLFTLDISDWVDSVLRKPELAQQLKKLNHEFSKKKNMKEDEALFQFIYTIDPTGPITWSYSTFCLNSMCHVLMMDPNFKKRKNSIADFFSSNIIGKLVRERNEKGVTQYYGCQEIFQSTPDYAIERIMYYLNPELHCQSPLTRQNFIRTIHELILMMDQLFSNTEMKFDNHMIAFIIQRSTKAIPNDMLKDLSHIEKAIRILAFIRLINYILKAENEKCPKNLFNYIYQICIPVLDQYKSKKTSDRLKLELDSARGSHDIDKLLAIVDNTSGLKSDHAAWLMAQKESESIDKNIQFITENYLQKNHLVKNKSRIINLSLCMLLSIFIGILVYNMMGDV
jgi:serine/threonine protein kinase